MTLVAACYLKNFGLTIFFLILQSCALAWRGCTRVECS
jgi:hypothetical protein